MTAQNLNGYLNGERRPGRAFISRLDRLGCDISLILHEDTAGAVSGEPKAQPTSRSACESIDFDAAELVLGRSLERASPQFGATPDEVRSWRSGTEPPLDKLVRLTNLILFVATDGRLSLRELSPSSPRPANEESRQQLTGT